MGIHTPVALGRFVENLVDQQGGVYQGTLEEYLRSLLGLLDAHRTDTPSWTLFGNVLEESFKAKPVEFDERWLLVEKMPYEEPVTESTDAELFDHLRALLVFQIADLRRIFADKRLSTLGPADYWLGIESPTNTKWYNQFWPDFLKQGVSSFTASQENASWTDMIEFLLDGQFYE